MCVALAGCSSAVSGRSADLAATDAVVDEESPAAGAKFTLSVTVRNVGARDAPATTLRYYRSTDATITTSDTGVGMATVAELAAAGSSRQSVTLTAPATEGTYYYGACVDAVPDETDPANNCSASVEVTVQDAVTTPRGNPDLMITVLVSDNAPAAGAEFTLSATVSNGGDGAGAATTLRYYRSADATITAADAEVGRDAVTGLGAAGSAGASVQLTAPATPGTYYYGACVDVVTDESDTTNNCSSSVPVTVREPSSEGSEASEGKPDLTFYVVVIATGPLGFAPGGYFVLFATIQNDGDGASPATTLRYYRSTDETITTADMAVGTDAVAGLAASEFSRESLDVQLPSSPGTYYYGVCVDAVAGESDTTNNCSKGGRVVSPQPVAQKSVEVTPREVTLAALGDTVALTARVLDAQGNEISGEAVSWYSLSLEVATVDAAGVVTAVGNGRAMVVASASGVSGVARVIVDQRVVSVDIDPGEVELTSVATLPR